MQKGTSSHGGPPAWFLEYFEKMDESLGEIKQQEKRSFKNKKGKSNKLIDSGIYFMSKDNNLIGLGTFMRNKSKALIGFGIYMPTCMSNNKTLIKNTMIGWLARRLNWKAFG